MGVQLLAVAGPGVAHAATGGAVGLGPAEAHVAMAVTIPAGTDIPVTIDESIALKGDQVGNTFPAHVTRDVVVDGAVAIRGGTPASVILVASDEKPGAATFRLARVSIGGRMRRVETGVARADAAHSGLSTAKKTGIGALAGGVLSVVTGGGLLKGAIVGAGGGLAWGLLDHGTRRVEQDTQLLFPLRASLRVA
ncbi:MAG TPA: hypothetical protein VM094_08175 [Gemmatimonadales bacterium]|nr:hypothetical protein [Gemmatimonadales bacterium]